MDAGASSDTTRPNLAAVAALAGVSASTASLAFSGAGPVSAATKERVLAAAAKLNYAGPDPRAQGLRRGRSGVIGVIMEDRLSEAFRDPMNIAMLDGVADELSPSGSGLLLLTGNAEGATSIHNAPVDAVILVGCSTRLANAVTVFKQRGLAIVGIETEPMSGVLSIDLDNRVASRALAQHLHDLGHENVAMVTLPLDPNHASGPLTAEREESSEGWTASQRILGTREVYPNSTGVTATESSIEAGHRAGLEVLSGRPTAVMAQSDLLAVGVIRAAQQLGLRVPEDVSVVGFDGIRLDGIAPHDLTTMVQPAFEKGRAAARGVLELLDGETAEPVSFSSVFHLGATTAPPR